MYFVYEMGWRITVCASKGKFMVVYGTFSWEESTVAKKTVTEELLL